MKRRVRRDIEDTVIAMISILGLDRSADPIADRIQRAIKYKRQGDLKAYSSLIEDLHDELARTEE